MKKRLTIDLIYNLVLAGLLSCMLPGCENDTVYPLSTTSTLKINVSNTVNGTSLQLGQMAYTNVSGNNYQVDLLRYYLSNFSLVKSDSNYYNLRNYDLIDAENAESCKITGDNVPNGKYTYLCFYVGVDSTHNNSIDQTGDLDPLYGMFWPWNTGYIFFKHEGYYVDSLGSTNNLLFHYGTAPALVTVAIPVNIELSGSTCSIDLQFDLNSVYNTPTPIDFNVDNYHQSASGSERDWIETMKQNLSTAFTITAVH